MDQGQRDQAGVHAQEDRYGAHADERGPLGGGEGYHDILTDGDYRVSDAQELIDALEQAQAGEVIFIEPDAEIDLTVRVRAERMVLDVPGGVTIASNRGHNGTPGGLIHSDEFDTRPLFDVKGPDVRFTGIRLRGPDTKRREDLDRLSFGPNGRGHNYYYKFPTATGIRTDSDRLVVDNCELSGWSHAGIFLRRGVGHAVHHNHIHHNQREALGYGLTHDVSESLIECNIFDANRHSIAATGRPGSGYEARHNLFLERGQSHGVDMHGGRDRQDGTQIAGDWLNVHHNTFRQNESAKAIAIRGVPDRLADIHHNWFVHFTQPELAVRTSGNTDIHDNVYGPAAQLLAVDAQVEIVEGPTFDAAGDATPGRLRLRLANHSAEPCEGVIGVSMTPADAVKLAADDGLEFSLQPGQALQREVQVHLADPGRAPRQLELAPKCSYSGIKAPSVPYAVDMTVTGEHLLPTLAGPVTWATTERLLESTPERSLELDAARRATLRMAMLGDHVVVEARVDDDVPQRGDPIWTGSTLELFGGEPGGPAVGQVLLVSETREAPAAGFHVEAGVIMPSPRIKARHLAHERGYAVRALIPLDLLALDPASDAHLLEAQVSWRSALDQPRRYKTMFGSPRAFATHQFFGRFRRQSHG